MDPAVAETVQKIKRTTTGSNENLIGFTADGDLVICGVSVHTLPAVDAATLFWGIPEDRVVTVLRKDAEVTRSKDSGFYNDALDLRAITRVGIRVPPPGCRGAGYDAALHDGPKGLQSYRPFGPSCGGGGELVR